MYSPVSLVISGVFLPLLDIVALCVRFWVRLRIQPTFVGTDDYFIMVGCALACVMGGMQIAATELGEFSEESRKTEYRKFYSLKTNYAEVVIEKLAYGFIKLSILLFYRRIFYIDRGFRRINNVAIALITSWTLIFFFCEAFQCDVHPEIIWTGPTGALRRCINAAVLDYAFAITDVVGDLAVIILPFPSIRKLQMGKREKWGLAGIFALGFLSTAAGILRLGFLSEAYVTGQLMINPLPPPNPEPYALRVVNPGFWTNLELWAGVLAACLPHFRPLIGCFPSCSQIGISIRRKMSYLSPRQTSTMPQKLWFSQPTKDTTRAQATTLQLEEGVISLPGRPLR